MVRVGVALLLGLGLLGACSGKTVADDDDSSSGGTATKAPPKPSPVVECQTYANTWCTKVFGCSVQDGRLDAASLKSNVAQCIKILEDRLPCSGVTATGDDFDTCIKEIKAMACSKFNVPPTQIATIAAPDSCNNALSFE